MPRYIDKQKVVDALHGITAYKDTIPLSSAVFNIEKIPAADVVEVVRCNECKWWAIVENIFVSLHTCKKFDGVRYGNDFCSRGERREE